MTTDATSDPNDGVSVDGTGQNQSDVFRGESHAAESRRGSTEKGISARSVPAFVAGRARRPGRVRFADCRDDGGPGVGQSTH